MGSAISTIFIISDSLGILIYWKLLYISSIECFDIALRINQDDIDALKNKGIALSNLKKYDEAIESFDEAIRINPDCTDAWNSKGMVLFNLKKYDESKKCLEMAISINSVQSYPEWSKLKSNLNLLHPLMLKQLLTTMCFIVLDQGTQHAATIVRVPASEFPNTIETTPMRLHIGLCRTKYADLFFFYPIVADSKDLWWTETWIYPYDDELIDSFPNDPIAKDARKKLSLLLNQEYSYALIVDENNKLRCTRKVSFTKSQREGFSKLTEVLKEYEGNKISIVQAKNAIDDYLAKISKSQLQQQFELLLREE
jgi:tetratricopeptide (TPR) repeat protein